MYVCMLVCTYTCLSVSLCLFEWTYVCLSVFFLSVCKAVSVVCLSVTCRGWHTITTHLVSSLLPTQKASIVFECRHRFDQSSRMYQLQRCSQDAARQIFTQCKGAEIWLEAIQSSETYAIGQCHFRVASFLLGIAQPGSLPFSRWRPNHVAGAGLLTVIDTMLLACTWHALLACKLGGRPARQHDSVVSRLSECPKELNIYH